MLLKKTGFPEEDELVLCTVTNIHFHSVFAKLDEFENKTGLIHISEISPGRIRNIRDYVVEGKVIVCKVLRIDTKQGHIDLSLRRVNDNQKRKKVNEIKQEQKSEKIIEQVAKQNNEKTEKLYKELTELIFKKYDDLASCFKEVVKKPGLLEKLGIDKDISKQLDEIIQVRFKEEDINIGGLLNLKSYQPDGLEVVKKTLIEAEKVDKSVTITYAGGGSYKLNITSKKYKEAEKTLEKVMKKIETVAEKDLVEFSFSRKDKKE